MEIIYDLNLREVYPECKFLLSDRTIPLTEIEIYSPRH